MCARAGGGERRRPRTWARPRGDCPAPRVPGASRHRQRAGRARPCPALPCRRGAPLERRAWRGLGCTSRLRLLPRGGGGGKAGDGGGGPPGHGRDGLRWGPPASEGARRRWGRGAPRFPWFGLKSSRRGGSQAAQRGRGLVPRHLCASGSAGEGAVPRCLPAYLGCGSLELPAGR